MITIRSHVLVIMTMVFMLKAAVGAARFPPAAPPLALATPRGDAYGRADQGAKETA